jgi:hypothetical protein
MSPRLPAIQLLLVFSAFAETPNGRWDGTVTLSGLPIPFRIYFDGTGKGLSGVLANGDARTASKSGSVEDGMIRLDFGIPGGHLEGKLSDGALVGTYTAKGVASPFKAVAYCTCATEGEAGPPIAGEWELPAMSGRLTVRREGDDTLATLTQPDGGIGPMAGRFNGAFFELAYFDGERGAILELEPRKDGGMDAVWKVPGKEAKMSRATPSKATR